MLILRHLFSAAVLLTSAAQGALQWKGADWSSVAVLERDGIVEYKNLRGEVAPLENILAENGINVLRQRVWVAAGDYDLAYNIALAKRAIAAGLACHINLHFSDSWADPGQQRIPAGWPTDLAGLEKKIYDYTLDVCNTLQAEGIQPAMIDIGNEIADGLLWPVGRGRNSWPNVVTLLRSASNAIKASNLSPKPKINVHLNGASDEGVQRFFWDNVLAVDPDFPSAFDIYSASFYPFYGPEWNFTRLTSTLTELSKRLPGKELLVSEMTWPFSCNQGGNFPFPPDMRPSIPFSAAGQKTWVKEVASRVEALPGGIGVEYWEIAWVNNAGLGQTGCEDNIMFEFAGNARESLTVFSEI
ncbi:unnamed protein product [Discula destructiva]